MMGNQPFCNMGVFILYSCNASSCLSTLPFFAVGKQMENVLLHFKMTASEEHTCLCFCQEPFTVKFIESYHVSDIESL